MSRTRLLLQTDLKKCSIELNKKIHYHHLVLNMVEDVQTVENVERNNRHANVLAGGGSGGGSEKAGGESLTAMTNALTELWRNTILCTDESLAQVYLQVKGCTTVNGGENGDGGGGESGGGGGEYSGGGENGGGGGNDGNSTTSNGDGGVGEQKRNIPKMMNKRQATVNQMKSFGLLQGSTASMEMLMSTEIELKKIMMTTSSKSDPNETYPSMLMLEMVTDCLKIRLNHQLAKFGHVQQCYDTCITNAETNLPQLMPKYDLTFTEFKTKLQMMNE